jgi:hypothetical protein
MANPIFLRKVLKDLVFDYPRIDSTYRFDSANQRSEKCAPTAATASWSIGWSVSKEDAIKFRDEMREHYEACQKIDSGLPEFKKIFGMKKLDSGLVSFRAKKNGASRDGNVNEAPTVIDGAKNQLADRAIWSGSKGAVRIIAFPTKSPDGTGGISLILDTVQVTQAEYGSGGDDDDFDTHEVKPIVAAPISEPTVQPVPPVKQAPSVDVMDDEIPF